jgi:ADP-ribose pyrophosphatase
MDLEEKLLRTEIVFKGQYVQTEVQTVRLPDGKEARREIVSPPDAVGILAIDASQKVYLVRQYRPAIRQITIEIPAGIIENGEDPLRTADRECQEETGMQPGQLTPLCSFYHSVGFSTGKIQVFLAENLKATDSSHTEPGEFLQVITMQFEEFFDKILRNEIVDSKSIVAALWYKQIQTKN